MAAPPTKAGVAASIVGGLCLYEVVSNTVNVFLETDTLPTVTRLTPPTVRAMARRLSPSWLRYGALMMMGLLVGAVTQRRRVLDAVAAAAPGPG